MNILHAEVDQDVLHVDWGHDRRHAFHLVWLRDNRPTHYHAHGQKTSEPQEIRLKPQASTVHLVADKNVVRVTWADDGVVSEFSSRWLLQHAYDRKQHASHNRSTVMYWTAADMRTLPEFEFAKLFVGQHHLAELLRSVRDLGIALVHGVPPTEEALLDLIQLFGFVRETNYGRTFEVQSVADAKNLAYTARGLSGHTDNPYRDPVPSLQCLHVLQNDAEGGDSTFVDGFTAAAALRHRDPAAFDLLRRHRVLFRYSTAEVDLCREAPIIQTDQDGGIEAIHFNSRSIQPFQLPPDQMLAFYAAYRSLSGLFGSDEFLVRRRMQVGEAVLFNNLRLLHGRTGYRHGTRHLRGCYADLDGLLSKLRVLERKE